MLLLTKSYGIQMTVTVPEILVILGVSSELVHWKVIVETTMLLMCDTLTFSSSLSTFISAISSVFNRHNS